MKNRDPCNHPLASFLPLYSRQFVLNAQHLLWSTLFTRELQLTEFNESSATAVSLHLWKIADMCQQAKLSGRALRKVSSETLLVIVGTPLILFRLPSWPSLCSAIGARNRRPSSSCSALRRLWRGSWRRKWRSPSRMPPTMGKRWRSKLQSWKLRIFNASVWASDPKLVDIVHNLPSMCIWSSGMGWRWKLVGFKS